MPWEAVGDEIRHRVVSPEQFEPGTFRRITLKEDKPRVFAVVAKLTATGKMTVQALRFPLSDGWTVESAQKWTREHNFKTQEIDMERKAFGFEVKEIGEAGQFSGYASVYNVIDHGGDIVEPGAFAKTIKERGEVPILWSHRSHEPIGMGTLQDTESGLIINGRLVLDLPEGQNAYTRLKSGIVRGLSIGYEALTAPIVEGVRHLKEIRLREVSLCVFPMNEFAQITAVKAEAEQSLESKLLAFIEEEIKAGRRLSEDTLAQLHSVMAMHQAAMDKLRALMGDIDGTPPKGGAATVLPPTGPQQQGDGPAYDHSALIQLIERRASWTKQSS